MSSTTVLGPRSRALPPLDRLSLVTGIAVMSYGCYIAARFMDGAPGLAFAAIGVGACGWAWLAARALFDPAGREAAWVMAIGGLVVLTGATAVLAPEGGMLSRVADNIYAITGSAAVLLTFVEPFHRWRADLSRAEKAFRWVFVTVYAALVTASMLGLRAVADTPEEAAREEMIKAACATVGLIVLLAQVAWRRRHPLTAPRRVATDEDQRLAEQLTRLVVEEGLALKPDLKIAEVAARLNQPEHRVSQAIGAALGFANFNRWINHHRVEHARRLLLEAPRRSILQIAFDCGFASLGPFNRAFRDQTGMTPRAWRAARREEG